MYGNCVTRNRYTTQPPNMQDKYTVSWLYEKGWTVAAAARRLKRSTPHLYYVLTGKRQSKKLLAAVDALPQRSLSLRERLSR